LKGIPTAIRGAIDLYQRLEPHASVVITEDGTIWLNQDYLKVSGLTDDFCPQAGIRWSKNPHGPGQGIVSRVGASKATYRTADFLGRAVVGCTGTERRIEHVCARCGMVYRNNRGQGQERRGSYRPPNDSSDDIAPFYSMIVDEFSQRSLIESHAHWCEAVNTMQFFRTSGSMKSE
jgi:hypothetical protein